MSVDVEEILNNLTLGEKASLCSGAARMKTVSIDRLNIPKMIVSDGPHGIRVDPERSEEGEITTCFPTASTLGSAWNTDLIEEIGAALGKECQYSGIHVLLAPGVNMKRSPLCGRNFEYYSEDPYLSGRMGAAFVEGVQGQGVGTSLKHYAANNQEYQRMRISAEINERTLREIYLPAFEHVVKEAEPWTVMCAYNKINGTYASEHPYLLTEILREEWDFDGFVVTDWGAINDRVEGLKAGLDLEMPGPSPYNDTKIKEAVKSEELDEEVLDEAVKRILKIVFKAKEKENPDVEVDAEEHHALAQKVVSEGSVLLKNEDEILPLNEKNLDSISVIGKTAEEPRFQGGGSSEVDPEELEIPIEKIEEKAEDTTVRFARGYEEEEIEESLIDEATEKAEASDVSILFLSVPRRIESEGFDRPRMKLPENQIKLLKEVSKVQPNTVVVLNNGSAVEMDSWIDNASALLEAWLPGEAGGGAIADILFGDVNPSGKLQETFPKKLEDNPSYLNFPGEKGKVRYGEGQFIGYRYYDKKEIEPKFPFGFGLSYTEFEYHKAKLDKEHMKDTEELNVSIEVKNTGDVEGKEIIQLYVKEKDSELVRPEKELKGFAKVKLDSGKSKTVNLTLEKRDFAHYDPEVGDWLVGTGEYDILIGSSSRDIRQKKTVHVESTAEAEITLDKYNSLNEWLESDIGKSAIKKAFPEELLEGLDEFGEMAKNIPLYKTIQLSQGNIPMEILEDALEIYEEKKG